MGKAIKTTAELAHEVLMRLKLADGCEGVSSVAIHVLDDDRVDTNWSVGSFNPGTASIVDCERALEQIIPIVQAQYQAGPRVNVTLAELERLINSAVVLERDVEGGIWKSVRRIPKVADGPNWTLDYSGFGGSNGLVRAFDRVIPRLQARYDLSGDEGL